MPEILLPDLCFADGAFHEGYALCHGDGAILACGPAADVLADFPEALRVPLARRALCPGTVNAHNHSFQSLLRGIADDTPFLTWRDEALYKFAPRLNTEGIYAAAAFAFAEMLLRGVTTVCDFFYLHDGGNDNARAVMRAAEDLGIRLVLARTMYDWDGAPEMFRETVEEAVERTRALHAEAEGRPLVTVLPAPHSPHAASPEMIRAGAALAEALGTPFHIHVAEEPFEVEETLAAYGLTPVHYLESLGVLSARACLVHCVHVQPEEVALMGARGAGLLYNPNSNMFLGDGITPLTEMLAANVTIALGTDGGCSNSRVSVFDEMRSAALLQKVRHQDGMALGAEAVFEMGTSGGAALLDLPVGHLKVGERADLVCLDLDDLSLMPNFNLLKNVVYAMSSTAIRDVMVEGAWVVQDRVLLRRSIAEVAEATHAVTAPWGAIR